MFLILRRSYLLIASLFTLMFFSILIMVFGPTKLGFADQFEDLLGEAVTQGTQVDAARARKDAAESSVRKAWSKFLPSVKAYGDFGHSRNNALGRMNGNRNSYDSSEYGVSASLPIYKGGTNYHGLKEAKANAIAEGHSFVETKQVLLLDTVRAILGIIRDREIVHLQKQNQNIVGTILRTTQSRYDGGEATRTDIAIAEDQYFAAQSVFTQAIDNLNSNETEFKRIIGRKAGRLSLPRGLPSRLPKSLNEAIALAEQQNPQLLASIFRSEAADHSLKASYGGFLPSVDLNLDYKEERFHGAEINDDSDLTVKLNFTVPLFKPEAYSSSQVSRHVARQRQFEARDARLTAKAMATVAWRSYHTAQKRYRLALVRIRAAKEASRGMRRELEAGQRTVLDVLDTQERLVQAKVQASNAKYERYMAAHLLLSAIGRLDVTTSNVAQLNEYVPSSRSKYRRDHGWKTASIKETKAPSKISHRKHPRSIDTGFASLKPESRGRASNKSTFYMQAWKAPALPVLKVKLAEHSTPLTLPKLKPRTLVQPERDALKVQQKKTNDILPTDQKKEMLIRRGIYSKLEKQQLLSNDEIVTGSVKKLEVKPVSPPQLKPKKTVRYKANSEKKTSGQRSYGFVQRSIEVAVSEERHRAFAVHKIPLPIKKSSYSEELVTGSLKARKERPQKSLKKEVYPATYQNRFAVWWNGQVDKVFGPSGREKPVLVDIEEYRKHRKEALKK